MFKSWYSNFYEQLIKFNSNSNDKRKEKINKTDSNLQYKMSSSSSTSSLKASKNKNHNIKNSSKISTNNNNHKMFNSRPRKNPTVLKPSIPIVKANFHNNSIYMFNTHYLTDFSNIYLNTFQSLVHYGDNIGAKIVKCLINENSYESQSLIHQEYDIYQVN